MRPVHSLPITDVEIDEFLHAFEAGTLPKERFTHAAHILTGASYVHEFGESAAIDRMRQSIRRFNESVGGRNTNTSGYHETITLFWIKLLARLHKEAVLQAAVSREQFAALAVGRFAHRRDLLSTFYDFDLVGSTDARLIWISPTRRSLDEPLP